MGFRRGEESGEERGEGERGARVRLVREVRVDRRQTGEEGKERLVAGRPPFKR